MNTRNKKRLDPIHAMLLGNLVWGIGLGLLFAAGIYGFDLGHIRTLAAKSPNGMLAVALLTAGSVITISSVVMGGAVMLIPRAESDEPKGGRRVFLRALVPVRVRAVAGAQGMARRFHF
jgi:hypothetical protein